ncbi:MAG TPA: T9SS type A sorting domain-containing protein [Bacteroidia bacterium]|jgi:hypothetical protein|nr:T9SS type A sorting domain-containing protein [Bacteroidia bacterium]
MKKKYYILFSLFTIILTCNSVAQSTWVWSKQGTSTSDDNVSGICTDKNGDVYIIGDFGAYFSGSPGLGVIRGASYIHFGNDSVYNNGVNQIFLVKYNGSNGNVIWAKGIGANNPYDHSNPCDDCEKGYRVAYDSVSNSIYITGTIFGSATFGSTTLFGSGDMFLSKLDINGNFKWTKLILCYPGGMSNSNILTDKKGSIYIAGGGLDSMKFGNNIKIAKGGYVAKYDSSGTCLWAKRQTGTAFNKILLYKNDIYGIGNNNKDTIVIGTSTYTLSASANSHTGIVTRMDSVCNVKWIKFMTSSQYCGPGCFVNDKVGLYITGMFLTDITIGANTFTNTAGNSDMFYVKYDTSGNLKWAHQANATNYVGASSMVTDASGKFYVGGGIGGSLTFGSTNFTASSSLAGFLARFDTSGSCLGVIAGGGYLAEDNAGSVFVTSGFQYTTTIGSNTYTAAVTSPPTADLYVAKHGAITGIGGRQIGNANNQLLIYANPMAGKCNITIPDDFVNEKNLTLQIFDISGKLLQNAKIEMQQEKIKLNLEAEAKGTYNVILTDGKKSYTGKIIFE